MGVLHLQTTRQVLDLGYLEEENIFFKKCDILMHDLCVMTEKGRKSLSDKWPVVEGVLFDCT